MVGSLSFSFLSNDLALRQYWYYKIMCLVFPIFWKNLCRICVFYFKNNLWNLEVEVVRLGVIFENGFKYKFNIFNWYKMTQFLNSFLGKLCNKFLTIDFYIIRFSGLNVLMVFSTIILRSLEYEFDAICAFIVYLPLGLSSFYFSSQTSNSISLLQNSLLWLFLTEAKFA